MRGIEQFGFMRGSSCADADVSLAGTILSTLDQRAGVQLHIVALVIKGTFDRVCWKGLLCHLWNVGVRKKALKLFESYLSNSFI